MSGRLTAVVVSAMCFVGALVPCSPAVADEGASQTVTTADGVAGQITAVAGSDSWGGQQDPGSDNVGPRCTYKVFDLSITGDQDVSVGALRRDAATRAVLTGVPASESTETLYRRTCRGQDPDFVWVPDKVNEVDLLASARQQVSAQLPDPQMDLSPDPAVGGTVNVGLWLAVADPGVVSVTASVGPVWATVTAREQRTTWDMGNGDVVDCDGLGTPIVDLDTAAQGPCGYTYLWPSAPKFTHTDDLAYHASVTGHWVITYATSAGSVGSLPSVDRTTQFRYQVRELQSVRVGDDG